MTKQFLAATIGSTLLLASVLGADPSAAIGADEIVTIAS
jgi:hypothetical protein